jgi:predicted RNA-binding Zn ribbon-like protein
VTTATEIPQTPKQVPETPERNAAPERLELVREFVNTLDVEEQSDSLTAPSDLKAWLAQKRLLGRQDRVTATDHQRALDFREALREILAGHTDGRVGPGTVRRFDAVVSHIPMRLRVDDTGWVRVAAAGTGFDAAQAELLARVYEAMEDGTWERLKVCAEGTCQSAFFDHSKNRSGHWCSMAVCGNRAKVSAFRQRHAAEAAGSPRKASARKKA